MNDDVTKDDTPVQSCPCYQLKVQNQPPNFIFLGEPFTIDFVIVEEDRNHPEKACTSSTGSTGALVSFTSDSYCTQKDVTLKPFTAPLNLSFEIIVELLPMATHESIDNSIKSTVKVGSEIVSATDESKDKNAIIPSAASRVVHVATSQQRIGTLTLNVLRDPSPLHLGELGTIQCSLTEGNVMNDMSNDVRSASLHQRKVSTPSSAISAIVWDANPGTCQIRIIAFCCGNDSPPRNKTNSRSSTSNPPKRTSSIALTSSITIVRHKILITSCTNEGNSHGTNGSKNQSTSGKDWNSVWYKDEGGRDKCIEIVVGVYDRQHVALFEAIPLLLTLCYASSNQQSLKHDSPSLYPQLPLPVTNQDILNVLSPKSKQLFVLDRATGTMKIRFRVEDVSKNHQGQDFCLRIAAALDNVEYHYLQNYRPAMIAPAVSLSINVRSKRNKRPRQFTTISTNISIPASDVSSEQMYNHGSVVPSIGTVLSPTISSGANVESHPRLTTMQLQFALRNVVHWVQEVVTKTSFELQKQPSLNGTSAQYLSLMAESLATYHGHVQEHLNVLQYVIDFNTFAPSILRSQTDPNSNQAVYNTQECTYQRPPTTADQLRYYDTGSNPYSQGYYHQSTMSDGGNTALHQIYPYQYQNPMYYPVSYSNQYQPTSTNFKNLQPSTSTVKQRNTHKTIHQPREHAVYEYPTNESITEAKAATIPSKTQPSPMTQFHRPVETVQLKEQTSNSDRYHTKNTKKVEFQNEYPADAFAYPSSEAYEINADYHESRENEVEYVFAKQFKSLRTGVLLGYPAYTIKKELIGFYQQVQATQPKPVNVTNVSQQQRSDRKMISSSPSPPPLFTKSHLFVPIHEEDFGVTELEHAKVVFEEADPSAIQSMSLCGSIEAMLHRALVFEWSQGLHV